MSPRLEITQDMRIKICALRDEGFPFSAIANKFNISKNGVKYTIDRFNESGEYVNRIGRGRKRCTSDADDKNIILMSKRNRKMTAPDIREAFNSSHSGSPVSVTTIKDRLNNYGLFVELLQKSLFCD
ncbi:uncharacterized protein LOC122506406 [Leptopilina heterotoma]|uniref:uncharacterized protein LOC122506406 n=1 Tax=Leptopilina heterotoma TaxID=63436 RepID=UPI001CA87CA4|nr:uncharacterized protein LOC122506406 [Leptopilina heterotoma]